MLTGQTVELGRNLQKLCSNVVPLVRSRTESLKKRRSEIEMHLRTKSWSGDLEALDGWGRFAYSISNGKHAHGSGVVSRCEASRVPPPPFIHAA